MVQFANSNILQSKSHAREELLIIKYALNDTNSTARRNRSSRLMGVSMVSDSLMVSKILSLNLTEATKGRNLNCKVRKPILSD